VGRLTPLAKEKRKLILKWRRFLGLCGGCGAEAYGNSRCDRCQSKLNERTRKKRLGQKISGMCQECGNHKANSGGYRCDDCIELMRARKPDRICVTELCTNSPAYNRDYCSDCLDRRYTEKQSCKVYFIECIVCGEIFTTKTKLRRYCKQECRTASVYYGDGVKVEQRECKECGELFNTYNKNVLKVYCSDICSKRSGHRNVRHIRRMRERLAFKEVVNKKILYDRDRKRCQLCGKKLNLKRQVPHPLAVTVDHIVPLSKGGEHSYRNTQLLCFKCNSLKGDRPVKCGEQLLLFG